MKQKSIILLVVGITLISIGTSFYFDLLKFSINDTTPPEIDLQIPFKSLIMDRTEAKDIATLIHDPESNISSVVYYDQFYSTGLIMQHTATPPSWFPYKTLDGDVNDDWAEDFTDVNLVGHAIGTVEGDPDWNPKYDVIKDGRVDTKDWAYVASASRYNTYLYTATHNKIPNESVVLTHHIIATNDIGLNSPEYSKTVAIFVSTDIFEGYWTVNNINVTSTNCIVNFTTNSITIKFVSIVVTNPTANVTINNINYKLTNITLNTKILQGDFLLYGSNYIMLTAKATINSNIYTNTLNIIVNTPEQPILDQKTIASYSLIISGIVVIAVGAYLSKEKTSRVRY